jgi:hypothetical protein
MFLISLQKCSSFLFFTKIKMKIKKIFVFFLVVVVVCFTKNGFFWVVETSMMPH